MNAEKFTGENAPPCSFCSRSAQEVKDANGGSGMLIINKEVTTAICDSCVSTFYGAIFVPPEVKEMLEQIQKQMVARATEGETKH